MWKSSKSRAEQQFSASQKKDDTLIKQKEKAQRERDERMARLRDLRLAKEAAERDAAAQPQSAAKPTAEPAEAAESPEEISARLPKVHPHRS
ncbi:MAG: hypothetical protein Kow00114_00480 [Kiloniellaceae bacterium]